MVKICGLCDIENLLDVAAYNPDFIGLIFAEKSPRYARGRLDPEELRRAAFSPRFIGVFVDASPEEILEAISEYDLQGVQLHGDESPEACASLRASNPELIILKGFAVEDCFDFTTTGEYTPFCNYFLFDNSRGGSGNTFNWELLNKYNAQIPFFLAGGIGVSHIDKVQKLSLRLPLFAGVDASTKLERGPGFKDISLVQSFIEGIRR